MTDQNKEQEELAELIKNYIILSDLSGDFAKIEIATKIAKAILEKYVRRDSDIITFGDKTSCQHDFYLEPEHTTVSSNANSRKWRCRKCLEVKYTDD